MHCISMHLIPWRKSVSFDCPSCRRTHTYTNSCCLHLDIHQYSFCSLNKPALKKRFSGGDNTFIMWCATVILKVSVSCFHERRKVGEVHIIQMVTASHWSIIQNSLQEGIDGILGEHRNLGNFRLRQKKTEGKNIYKKKPTKNLKKKILATGTLLRTLAQLISF